MLAIRIKKCLFLQRKRNRTEYPDDLYGSITDTDLLGIAVKYGPNPFLELTDRNHQDMMKGLPDHSASQLGGEWD